MTLRHTIERYCCLTFFLVTLLMSPIVRAATIGEETMINLTLMDGLAGETVNKVLTDHYGMVWIATTSGISVFDGRSHSTYNICNARGFKAEVYDICETKSNEIYAATQFGLYRLCEGAEVFEHILPEVERPLSLLAVGDTVFIGSEQGFQYWDGNRLHHHDVGVSRYGLDNIVRCYQQDAEGLIWFLKRHDLGCFNPRTGESRTIDLQTPLNGKHVLHRFAIFGTKFFIGTSPGGLYVYEPTLPSSARRIKEVGHLVTDVSLSQDGFICVATDGSGGYLIDPQTEQVVERYNMDASGMHRLPTNALHCFNRDANAINWFGLVRCGLAYEPHNSHLFKPYKPDGMSTQGMNIRSFFVRGPHTLLGLQDGLCFIDSERHIRRFFSDEELGGHIVNNIMWWQGKYYIGMFDGGVRIFDAQTLTVSHQTFSPLLTKNSIGDIQVGPDENLWVGCTDGLFIIRQDSAISHFTEQNSHITGGIIIDITFDKDGNAWLSGSKGLSLYSVTSHDIVEVHFPDGFWNNESFMRGYLGSNGTVYMRNGPELFYVRNGITDFGEICLPISLSDKWHRSMADDGKGHLLLSSERGLLYMNIDGSGLIQMGAGEGLLGSQISDIRFDADQRLWVATSNGLFTTTNDDILEWTTNQRYKVILYDVRKGGDLLTTHEMGLMKDEQTISLSWNFVSQPLQASPLLLDYARHTGRLYEYRLDDGEWLSVADGEPIDVRRLFLGWHRLTVRLMGVEGTETEYQLTVLPSFFACLELILLIIALVSFMVSLHFRKNTKLLLQERNEIEDALIESETLRMQNEEFISEQDALTQKYQKVRLDERECADIVERMKEYVERERVYTDPKLKMKDLADVLHLSAPKLSQVFNLYLKENYYEFINRYRLEEFKRLIDAGEYKRYTITALSEQCGFKKSNFFSTFRKVEGMTPAEYLKKRGVKV